MLHRQGTFKDVAQNVRKVEAFKLASGREMHSPLGSLAGRAFAKVKDAHDAADRKALERTSSRGTPKTSAPASPPSPDKPRGVVSVAPAPPPDDSAPSAPPTVPARGELYGAAASTGGESPPAVAPMPRVSQLTQDAAQD